MFKKYGLWVILLAGLLLRVYAITNPLLDAHGWRQADTASMAANFLQYGLRPLIPQLNYDGPPPNYVELEFPLSPVLISILWKFTGQLDWLARGVAVAFSGGTMVVIYLLGRELYDRTSALIAVTFFALNPMAIYFGRAVMPESPMLFFMTAAVLFLVYWYQGQGIKWLVLSALMLALALLVKLPAAMIAVPLFTILFSRYRGKILAAKQTWLFILLGLLPPLVYYPVAHEYAAARYVSGIIQRQFSLQPHYDYLVKTLRQMLTLALIVPGLFAPFLRRSRVGNTLVWTWAAVLVLYVFTVGARIQLEYYLFPLVPLACILSGATLGMFWGEAPGIITTLLILGTMSYIAYQVLPIYYRVDYNYLSQAVQIKQHTQPGNLLVLSDGPPMTFYYSGRKGWRLLPNRQTPAELEKLRAMGASAFVILPGSKPNREIIQYLNSHYPWVREGNFYDLSKPLARVT